MLELMRNPIVMRKVQMETRDAVGGKKKNRVTEEDIKELSYLQLVIKETLRLHPPAQLPLSRVRRKKCEVLGYEIPAKARVVVNTRPMERDPSLLGGCQRVYVGSKF